MGKILCSYLELKLQEKYFPAHNFILIHTFNPLKPKPMKCKIPTLIILVFILYSCNNAANTETDKNNLVFIEDTLSGNFTEASTELLPEDSVGIKNPETGEYEMMTYEEAKKLEKK